MPKYWRSKAEFRSANLLQELVGRVQAGGAPIEECSQFKDLKVGLEYATTSVLRDLQPQSPSIELDGFRFSLVELHEGGLLELVGLAMEIRSQAWTPCWYKVRASQAGGFFEEIMIRLGEWDEPGGLRLIGYHDTGVPRFLDGVLRRIRDIDWVYDVHRQSPTLEEFDGYGLEAEAETLDAG